MIHTSWLVALARIVQLSTDPEAKRLAEVMLNNLAALFNEQVKRI